MFGIKLKQVSFVKKMCDMMMEVLIRFSSPRFHRSITIILVKTVEEWNRGPCCFT